MWDVMSEVASIKDAVRKQLQLNPSLPSPLKKKYENIICKLTNYYKLDSRIFAVVLFGSLARRQAIPSSCIDLVVFVKPQYYKNFFYVEETRERIADYAKMGGKAQRFWGATCGLRMGREVEHTIDFNDAVVDLLFRADMVRMRDQSSICSDRFELEIGNYFVYCLPLYEQDDTYQLMAKRYLPFYDDEIRKQRLKATRKEFDYRIYRIKKMANRELYFYCNRLFDFAFKIFLQHLFIKKRKYPYFYEKWIKQQVTDILNEPELYEKLAQTLIMPRISPENFKAKADILRNLMREYGAKVR